MRHHISSFYSSRAAPASPAGDTDTEIVDTANSNRHKQTAVILSLVIITIIVLSGTAFLLKNYRHSVCFGARQRNRNTDIEAGASRDHNEQTPRGEMSFTQRHLAMLSRWKKPAPPEQPLSLQPIEMVDVPMTAPEPALPPTPRTFAGKPMEYFTHHKKYMAKQNSGIPTQDASGKWGNPQTSSPPGPEDGFVAPNNPYYYRAQGAR